MKIVAGHGVKDDRQKIQAVTENLSKDLVLAIDSNTTYNVQDTIKVGETASDLGLE